MKPGLRILMLEDDQLDAELIQRYLSRSGLDFSAAIASDKEEFIKAIADRDFDVILADNSLPQFNSFDALKMVKEQQNEIPFILVTGSVSEEFAVNIMQHGADDYILKNNLTRLPSAIAQALERHQIKQERKKAEQELRSAHEKLLFHIENTPLGFVEWDAELYVKSFSKRSVEIFGWIEDEVLNNRINGYDHVYQEDLPKVAEATRMLVSGTVSRNNTQHRNYTKDGRVIWCEWFNAAMRDKDGNIRSILSLVQDITERKKAEEELKETQYFLEKATEVAMLGYWIADISGTETDGRLEWSKGTLNIFGLDADRFDGNINTFLGMVYPDDLEMVKASMQNAARFIERYNIDHRILLPDKTIKWVHQQGEITVDEKGNPVLMIGVTQDITLRKQEEKELQDLNDQFRNLTSHLQSVREEERTNIAREVHDVLGQQMTSLKMDIAWIKNKVGDEMPDVGKKSANMLEMINETIRTVRKIITSLRPGILDDIGLVAAIEWQANEFEHRTGIRCNLKTALKNQKLTPQINTAVFRIFQETLTNVIRHAKATKVSSKLFEENNILILEIKDNGIGISDDRKNNKTSFGLMGMKERAAMLKGSFDVKRIPAGGTMVNLKIPL